VSAGKSRKNVNAYILLPPDSQQAIDALIEKRETVGIPSTNPFVFARMSSDTPLCGHTELKQIAHSCSGIQFPERITSGNLRKYIATVSQVRILLFVTLGQCVYVHSCCCLW